MLMAGSMHSLRASVATGQWVHYPSFTTPAIDVVCTPAKIYYLSGGSLFSYDTANDETESYLASNNITDFNIRRIFYNPAGKYLLVAYDTGNIDLLYDDGHRVNISDIRDSSLESTKEITGVDFAPGRIYIATDFGLVEYDDVKHCVVRAGIYNTKVNGVAALKNHVAISTDNAIHTIAYGGDIKSFGNFSKLIDWNNIIDLTRVNDSTMVVRRQSSIDSHLNLSSFVVNSLTGELRARYDNEQMSEAPRPVRGADGMLYITDAASTQLMSFDELGRVNDVAAIPAYLSGNIFGVGKGSGSDVWALDHIGLGHYDLKKSAVLSQKYIPASMPIKHVSWIIPSANGDRIYFTIQAISNYRYNVEEGLNNPQQTACMDTDGNISDVALYGYEAEWEDAINRQNSLGVKQPLSTTRLVEDPDDPSTYYLATASEGVFKIKNGKLEGRYDQHNSPVDYTYGYRVFDVAIDKEGNLWMTHSLPKAAANGSIVMLPAEKRRQKPSAVKKSDWKSVNAPTFRGTKDSHILICKKSNMIFVFDTRMPSGVVAIDTRGTYGDFSDDKMHVWTSFTDQDGKAYTPSRFTAVAEDADGHVWLGSTMGVIEIANPNNATNSAMTVNRIKVPRNDGTNSADYLLGSDVIYDISVDNANRKWLATAASGLYLVSPSGNEILEHYTPDNSPLPSMKVNCVYADRYSNSVFVGTAEGLYEYGGYASPAMDNFDDIYAYPNPVRPEYSGPVTIRGLMDGALVKICDASGRLLVETRAEGGMAVWDACNSAGRRVPTGVYYVFASVGGEGVSTSGAVAKILVVD